MVAVKNMLVFKLRKLFREGLRSIAMSAFPEELRLTKM
jgi:hypothetical protein